MDIPTPFHRRAVGRNRKLPEEYAHPSNAGPGPLGSRGSETAILPRHLRVPGINRLPTATGRECRAPTTREGGLHINPQLNWTQQKDRAVKLKGKDLKERTLDDWFKKRRTGDFGDLKTNYVARYNALEDFLKKDIHPLVSIGAAVADGIFLNDHGPAHVATVIKRASELISTETCTLTAYEAYILLAAI